MRCFRRTSLKSSFRMDARSSSEGGQRQSQCMPLRFSRCMFAMTCCRNRLCSQSDPRIDRGTAENCLCATMFFRSEYRAASLRETARSQWKTSQEKRRSSTTINKAGDGNDGAAWLPAQATVVATVVDVRRRASGSRGFAPILPGYCQF